MENAEVCVLTAVCPSGRLIREPWHHQGFIQLAKSFLRNHPALMGKESWLEFPFKDDKKISPWVLSRDPLFQMQTRAKYPHVRFAESVNILQRVIPLKGVWWILGGFSVFQESKDLVTNIESITVQNTVGTLKLWSIEEFQPVHHCINPFDSKSECTRYDRTLNLYTNPAFYGKRDSGEFSAVNLPK